MKIYKENTYYKDNKKEVYFEPSFKNVEELNLVEISKAEADEILKQKEQEPIKIERVTLRQAKLALRRHGYLKTVEAIIQAIPNEEQKIDAQIEWENAVHVERDNALLAVMKAQLKLTEEELDNLFLEASKI